MLERLQKTIKKLSPLGPHLDLRQADVKSALDYIAAYWHKVERYHPKDDESLVGLPKPFLVPSYEAGHEFDYNELYYWDSYFMVQGMLDEEHKELVMGILEDLVYLFERFKIIPNASRLYLTSRSQPPFLTSFIWDVYEAYNLDKKWLGKMLKVAEAEYNTVWMGTRKPNARQVYKGLSRYYDFNYLHDIAETESGWDMTTRFSRKALNFVPVDLNALLYKYEMDFARYYRLVDNKHAAAKWEAAAKYRKTVMNGLMWSNLRGIYFDYNYAKERRGTVSSLATYYPLWAGMVDKKQADQLVKALRRFEHRGGLATTDTQALNQMVPGVVSPGALPTQWAYPNGWAPLHYIVIKGLQRYGYDEDARRIALKWLKTNLDWFNKHGVFLEKYNVVSPGKPPAKGVYPSQTGFGWTNAVFERLCQEFVTDKK
ncbi:MAG TPA: trehalase family glycosidase [Candidatus Limnocylindria bacterium]|nr:trehalase family glycosidase [Candidatus Limnocylindria bacterium]